MTQNAKLKMHSHGRKHCLQAINKRLIESQQNSIGSIKMYKKMLMIGSLKGDTKQKQMLNATVWGKLKKSFGNGKSKKVNESECANECVRKIKIT